MPETAGGGNSDLFVIQGFAGQNPDHVTFISDSDPASLSGNPLALVPVMAGSSASPSDLGTLAETGDWQLAENTNPDQYYIQSDIPEPATMAVLGVSFLGLGFARRKRG